MIESWRFCDFFYISKLNYFKSLIQSYLQLFTYTVLDRPQLRRQFKTLWLIHLKIRNLKFSPGDLLERNLSHNMLGSIQQARQREVRKYNVCIWRGRGLLSYRGTVNNWLSLRIMRL